MDKLALQDGNFSLPEVLAPPESNYFSEVCFIFLVAETLLKTQAKNPSHLSALVSKPELILPPSLRSQLCKHNFIRVANPDDIPENVFVQIDDDISSVLKFLLGFISFKQPNFERTQLYCRIGDRNQCVLPLFMKQTPSFQTFEYFEQLEAEELEVYLRKEAMQPLSEMESSVIREAVVRHGLAVKNLPSTLAKDLTKFTN